MNTQGCKNARETNAIEGNVKSGSHAEKLVGRLADLVI